MSNDSNEENVASKQMANGNDNATTENKTLSFKDWKSLKEHQNKSKDVSENNKRVYKPKRNNNSSGNDGSGTRNVSNNSFNESNVPEGSTHFAGNKGLDFVPPNNFKGANNYNSNFRILENSCDPINNNFLNNFREHNNFGGNNFREHNNFGGNNFREHNNFGGNNFNNNNNFKNPNGFNNFVNSGFGIGRHRLNGPNDCNNFNPPESFFANDGIYRQRDLMQKPLPNYNPFRNENKANELLQEFEKSRYIKDVKKKTKGKKNKSANLTKTDTSDIKKLCNEPKVYVSNPKAKIDGKQYIPKPKIPIENLEITKEEKKQQWKEYRQAMKPFKNRDFYNAKRVVQRLGKKDTSELDEKQIIRLANARQAMDAHKAHLDAKYANYVKAEDSGNELGELYLLKKKPLNGSDFDTKQFQNYGNFGDGQSSNNFEAGRKIVGGNTGFKGFVSGGILEATVLPTQ